MVSIDETKTIPLYIDSSYRDADSKSSDDFTISLSKTLRRARRATVQNAIIPNTMNNLHENNNSFSFVYETLHPLSSTTSNYTVSTELTPELNITANGIVSLLNDKLISEYTEFFTFAYTTWSATYDINTSKMTIAVTVENISPFTVVIQNVKMTPDSCNVLLGLGFSSVPDTVVSGGLNITTYTWLSNIIYIMPANLFITSNTLSNSINTSYVQSGNKTIQITSENNTLKYTLYGVLVAVGTYAPSVMYTITIPTGFHNIVHLNNLIQNGLDLSSYSEMTSIYNDTTRTFTIYRENTYIRCVEFN